MLEPRYTSNSIGVKHLEVGRNIPRKVRKERPDSIFADDNRAGYMHQEGIGR
jgi:hypothetical protein